MFVTVTLGATWLYSTLLLVDIVDCFDLIWKRICQDQHGGGGGWGVGGGDHFKEATNREWRHCPVFHTFKVAACKRPFAHRRMPHVTSMRRTERPFWKTSKPTSELWSVSRGVKKEKKRQKTGVMKWEGGEVAADPDKVYHFSQSGLFKSANMLWARNRGDDHILSQTLQQLCNSVSLTPKKTPPP